MRLRASISTFLLLTPALSLAAEPTASAPSDPLASPTSGAPDDPSAGGGAGAAGTTAPSPGPSSAGPKPVYAVPFALRPALVPNVARIDAAIVSVKGGGVIASTFMAGAKVTGDVGIYARGAFVRASPDRGDSASALANPALFTLVGIPTPGTLKANVFAGVALPLGQGGGNTPDARKSLAVGSGIYARQAMDNALFAVNYLTPMVGGGVAHVANGLTLQAEVTVLQLFRARGGDLEKDSSRTNLTSGLHAGYAVLGPLLVVSAELHYQRWLSTPRAVDLDGTKREQATVGGGLRSNVALSGSVTARPGIGYFVPIDDPMKKAEYKAIVLDVPVTF